VSEETYREHVRWQTETDDYRNRLVEIAEASPSYAGSEIRHETREFLVFGVGEPTAALVALIDEAPSSIRVSWHTAPYSLAELTAEVKRIMTATALRARLYTGGARHDGTGMTFTTDDRSLLDADDPQVALGTVYPVNIEYGKPVTLLSTTARSSA
jgi:hypothetical protein